MNIRLKNNILAIMLLFQVLASTEAQLRQPTDALVSHIDLGVRPGNDFYLYANGKWFSQHPIPAKETSNGIFKTIQDTINEQIHNICVSATNLKTVEQGSNKQKIGDLYHTGMDSIGLNKSGITPIIIDLEKINEIKTRKGLLQTVTYLRLQGIGTMYGMFVAQDEKNSSKYVLSISQGGLSLPDREYYFGSDKRTVKVRRAFMNYATQMFVRMGYKPLQAIKASEQVMKLETSLARSSRKKEDLRDPLMNYNKLSINRLISENPKLEWENSIRTFGLTEVDSVIVGQPEFLKALSLYIEKYPLETWKSYLKLNLISAYSTYLDDKTFSIQFEYSKVINGCESPKPRWERVTETVDGSLGDLVGQVYVAEYLPKGSKEKLLEIGKEIKNVYADRIKNLDWMSAETKVKALRKLEAMVMKVGYPDKWKDMSMLKIDKKTYADNMKRVQQWSVQYMISKYGKPVDRRIWYMQPQTYNAYYNPSNNEIVVPGCNIIVPGYERTLADDAILYSIIGGSTFGHEMTHGFDDQGAKFDLYGNLTNWWTTEDSIKFFDKTKMIVSQFNNYVAIDSLHVNGDLTQGENIADLGGVAMGLEAFKKTPQYRNNQTIGGLTPLQRYFLGYAMAWMVNMRPEALANQVKTNEHSPARFRVNGPLSNIDEFYPTFDIRKDDPMWIDENKRVKIW